LKSGSFSWRINEQIRAEKLRVISSDGKQIGVLSKAEALKKSKKEGLDLIEIAPLASPPVAKIINFGKFRYQEEKKRRQEAKKAKSTELKEIRFTPFIAENDYNIRLERIKEFLAEKNKVKTVVVFKGRQLGSKQFGYSLLKRLVDGFGDTIAVDMEPKFIGRHLIMIISPVNKPKGKDAEDKN
jgi:translation initiation factor IF-3